MKKQNIFLSMLLVTTCFFASADIKKKTHDNILDAFDQLHIHLKESKQNPTLVLVFLESILTFKPTPEQQKAEQTITNALKSPSLTPEKQQELFQQLATIRLASLALQDDAIIQHINKIQKNSQVQVIGITMSPSSAADFFVMLFKKFGITFSSLDASQAIPLSYNSAEGIFKNGILCIGLELPVEHAVEALIKEIKFNPKQIVLVTDIEKTEQE